MSALLPLKPGPEPPISQNSLLISLLAGKLRPETHPVFGNSRRRAHTQNSRFCGHFSRMIAGIFRSLPRDIASRAEVGASVSGAKNPVPNSIWAASAWHEVRRPVPVGIANRRMKWTREHWERAVSKYRPSASAAWVSILGTGMHWRSRTRKCYGKRILAPDDIRDCLEESDDEWKSDYYVEEE